MTEGEINALYGVAKRFYSRGQGFREIGTFLGLTVQDVIYLLLIDEVSRKKHFENKSCEFLNTIKDVQDNRE